MRWSRIRRPRVTLSLLKLGYRTETPFSSSKFKIMLVKTPRTLLCIDIIWKLKKKFVCRNIRCRCRYPNRRKKGIHFRSWRWLPRWCLRLLTFGLRYKILTNTTSRSFHLISSITKWYAWRKRSNLKIQKTQGWKSAYGRWFPSTKNWPISNVIKIQEHAESICCIWPSRTIQSLI